MSASGVPPEISALQASQAQREAAKSRDRQRAVRDQGRGAEESERLFRVNAAEDIAEIHRFEEDRDKHDRSRRHRGSEHREATNEDSTLDVDDQGHLDITV